MACLIGGLRCLECFRFYYENKQILTSRVKRHEFAHYAGSVHYCAKAKSGHCRSIAVTTIVC